MNNKWLWIGQRLSDGILYSRALNGMDVFFSCEALEYHALSFSFYPLPSNYAADNIQRKWTSNDISKVVDCYSEKINQHLESGYSIFPYYLSMSSMGKMQSQNVFNKKVFYNQLTRTVQMYLCDKAGVRTPHWIIPNNETWAELVSTLGKTIVLQLDNTSSGMGTFIVHNENEYNYFCDNFGQADLAVEYIDEGYPCSVHLWITKDTICISPASFQIMVICPPCQDTFSKI